MRREVASIEGMPLPQNAGQTPLLGRSDIADIAVRQLGGWRRGVLGELRVLPSLLAAGESIECMVGGTTSWLTGELLVATDRRLLLVRNAWWRRQRCLTIAYEDIDVFAVTPGTLAPALTVASKSTTWTLTPYEAQWVDRLTSVIRSRTAIAQATPPASRDVIADPTKPVSLGWRAPASMALVLWVNALLTGALGIGFLWFALYPWLGATTSEPTVLGIGFEAMPTTFALGDFALGLGFGLAFTGFAAYLVWISRRDGSRVIADRDGIALRTRGRSRYAWEQIERFEIATLLDEGLVQIKEVDGHCAVMVLRGGERIALRALRTWGPFGDHGVGDVAQRVHTLNTMRQAG